MEWPKEETRVLASDRGGVIQGYTPIYSSLQLYLVQVIVIVFLCFVLGQLVKRWNQPRVIAEVIAGVLLGPSALGAIPGFTDRLFPDDAMESLTLTAHLGLVLFLFIVGLELDPGHFLMNAKKAGVLSITGQGITWVLSLGVSNAMITWLDDVESGTSFVLFIGVSLSVTAFPVLSRILGENSLMNTSVGALVISAASVDEACVWCLLALVVSTMNAGSPLDAFYVFLLLVFFVAVMLTVVKWVIAVIVREISVEETGPPSRNVVIVCMLMTLIAAWVTDFIGIDAIFGAFVAGIIVPRENSLHVRIAELIQDVVSVLLLPLYFAVSGLKTNLTLLDNGTSWGICFITIAAACLGKIGGGASVARFFGMTRRESWAVGVLMNTRGLVELIILNIGLDAGVLTEEVMAIMVVMALVTTFLTAPLAAAVYPLKYHTLPGLKAKRRVFEDSAGNLSRPLASIPDIGEFALDRLKLLVMVSNPAALGAVARVARLFSGGRPAKKAGVLRKLSGLSMENAGGGEMELHALRLVENTDRYSSDMRALERAEATYKDSLANILQGFLGLLMIKVKTHVSVGTPTDFCQDVTSLTHEHGISTVVFPWEARSAQPSTQLTRVERLMETTPCQFVVALNCHTTALSDATAAGVGLLVPFFGSDDDIAALLLALAIVERDSSVELVILSFLEPERPATSGGNLGGRRVKNGPMMASTMFASPQKSTKRISEVDKENKQSAQQEQPEEGKYDVERGVIPTETLPVTTERGSDGNGNDAGSSSAAGVGLGPGGQRSASWLRQGASRWSPRDLLIRAEEVDRVKVTPAWSMNATLARKETSAVASIVQEVAASQASGLVLCGCAGTGRLPSVSDEAGEGGGGPRVAAATAHTPRTGTSSVHGTLSALSQLGRSRHGPASLGMMTRTWHGKSRHRTRHHHHGMAAAAGGGGNTNARGGGFVAMVEEMIHDALQDIVGDVAGELVRLDRAPAVLAVRASKSTKQSRS